MQEMSVTAFKKMLHEEMGIKPEHQSLVAVGKPLSDGNKLGDYPIRDGSTVFLSLRLLGGSMAELEKGYQEHFDKVRNFPANAPQQNIACPGCFEPPSLKMPCKHGMCPTCLMKYVWTEVKEKGRHKVCCSVCKCEWPANVIWEYGNAEPMKEINLLERGLSMNYLRSQVGIKKCPKCNAFCERLDPSNNRVSCQGCRLSGGAVDFCWYCQMPWNNSHSLLQCGNAQCSTASIFNILREAPLITPKYLKDVKVPSRRLCPECGSLVELYDGCKQVTCTQCQAEFCFVCLKKKQKCSGSSNKCEVAPIQERIPGRSHS